MSKGGDSAIPSGEMTRRKKKETTRRGGVLTFILLGAVFVFALDWLFAPRVPDHRPVPVHSAASRVVVPPVPVEVFSPVDSAALAPGAGASAAAGLAKIPSLPAWKKYAQPSHVPPGMSKIAIIIDDVGIDRKRSIEAIALPAPVTLAFLPYAHRVDSLAVLARESGHELLVHMPMEPMDGDLDPGQGVLTGAMTPPVFAQTLAHNLAAIEGYVGINNHMGSRLTMDSAVMDRLMETLRARGLAFVDSRTTAQTIAAKSAQAHGLPYAERNVFLDHVPGIENVRQQLEVLEKTAREKGFAIAIGHPKDDTLTALRAWIPGLAERGFALVSITAVLHAPGAPLLQSAGFEAGSHSPQGD